MKTVKLSSRDAIIEAAFRTLNENPGASLSDVAAYAGVGRATLHRHFSSRDDLMLELAKIALTELEEAVEKATINAQSHTDGLRLSLNAIIPLANRQWFLSQDAIETNPEIVEGYDKSVTELHAEIEAAKAEGSVAKDIPTLWVAKTYENLIYAAWTMVREEEATPSQAADLAWRTFLKGISNEH